MANTTSASLATRAAGSAAEGAPREELVWATFSPETFARAKAEHKYIVLDGAAEWCHWCHVMEATTYHDSEVRKVLERHFIAVKVDVDSRPDIEERYGSYGWPATVIFAPDATEIGKYRGYIDPVKFKGILEEIVASGKASKESEVIAAANVGVSRTPLTEEHLAWIMQEVDLSLADYYDDEQGGWGRRQKAPLGGNNAWLLYRAFAGDRDARAQVVFTLDKQSALIDPVWSGVYQYSAAADWQSPHFEKLVPVQAWAIENYAEAFRLTRDVKELKRAQSIFGYVERFMKTPGGAFGATQDADLNAHDRTKPFMDGHDYYRKDGAGRLAEGVPLVDKHEYARENGLIVGAYCKLVDSLKDPAVLASASVAAKRIMETHKTARGGVTHDVAKEADSSLLYLADNAAFGFGLVRVYERTHDDAFLASARAIADFMLRELFDDRRGGFFASTSDPNAVGVFAVRRIPFDDNVMAIRFLAAMTEVGAESDAKRYSPAMDRAIRAISTPDQIKSEGRRLGEYLLALEQAKSAHARRVF